MKGACALLLLLAATACTAAASSLQLQHSLDGGKTWGAAGTITLLTSGHTGTAVLEREPLSAEQRRQLEALAASGGLYRLRLPSSAAAGAPPVATAFPARCLGAAGADGGLALDLLDARHVASIALNAPCGPAAAAADKLPASQALALRLPAAAPEVLPPLVGAAGAAAAGVPLQPEPSAAGQQGQGQQAAGQQGQQAAPGGKRAPPPDERSWLQKNWMMLMPLGFIVMNVLGNAANPQGQQRPGQGGAGVRAVPARR